MLFVSSGVAGLVTNSLPAFDSHTNGSYSFFFDYTVTLLATKNAD